MSDPLVGMQLGEYIIGPHIAEGAMGAIYRAFKPGDKRAYVVKVMLAKYCRDPEIRKRFKREVVLQQRLHHKYIVPILTYGEQDGMLYFVMPFIGGVSLANLMKEQHFTPLLVWSILEPIANALEYAHSQGVIHRDLKPSNILVQPDSSTKPAGLHPFLADFGLSRPVDNSGITPAGMSIGTPHYMSPEQVLGQPVTAASDIYSLGIMIYELLLGRVPFDDNNSVFVAMKQIRENAPLPRTLNQAFPARLESTLMQALEKDPERRYRTASELSSAYRQALQILGPDVSRQSYVVQSVS